MPRPKSAQTAIHGGSCGPQLSLFEAKQALARLDAISAQARAEREARATGRSVVYRDEQGHKRIALAGAATPLTPWDERQANEEREQLLRSIAWWEREDALHEERKKLAAGNTGNPFKPGERVEWLGTKRVYQARIVSFTPEGRAIVDRVFSRSATAKGGRSGFQWTSEPASIHPVAHWRTLQHAPSSSKALDERATLAAERSANAAKKFRAKAASWFKRKPKPLAARAAKAPSSLNSEQRAYLDAYLERLRDAHRSYDFEVEPGRAYSKVWKRLRGQTSRSIVAFVGPDGTAYKADSAKKRGRQLGRLAQLGTEIGGSPDLGDKAEGGKRSIVVAWPSEEQEREPGQKTPRVDLGERWKFRTVIRGKALLWGTADHANAPEYSKLYESAKKYAALPSSKGGNPGAEVYVYGPSVADPLEAARRAIAAKASR